MSDFLCKSCGKGFKSDGDLGLHEYNAHDQTPLECKDCGKQSIGRQQFNNHNRKHKTQKQKVYKCEMCQFEGNHASNFQRHMKLHNVIKEKEQKPKKSRNCAQCGKMFDRKNSFDRHMINAHKESVQTFPCIQCNREFSRKDHLKDHQDAVHASNIHSEIGHGSFEKRKKVKKVKKTFLCEKCAKTFNSQANLSRHFLTSAHRSQAKKGRSRWSIMRKVRKLLKDSQFTEEIGKKWKDSAGNDGIDGTLVETIMSQVPNISNRNLLRTLTILRKKLPKKVFRANLKKVIQERTNLCDELFETEFSEVLDSNGENIDMPITHAKHLNTLISLVCEKRGLCDDDVKVVLGIDGGQSKLIATMAIVPKDELDKKARMEQSNVRDRSKSTSTKRCLVIARVDQVPENYTNVTILMSRLNLTELKKDFCVVADLKLVDIMVGIQSTSSMHPCPYCDGAKFDKKGVKTNQKGTFVKGRPRTMKNVQEHFQDYMSSDHPNRKHLMNHASVQFPPIYIHAGQENMTVMQLYPPPQLHCGILGLGNDAMRKLEEFFPQEMEEFYAKHHIKGSGPGGQFNGPTIKKILGNHNGKLDELENIVSKHGNDYKLFIEHLRNLEQLNIAVNLKRLDKELIAGIIDRLGNIFQRLQARFDLSMPLKVHVILHHYLEFFETFGETLLTYSDEITEAMHSQIRLFEDAHRYVNNQKGSNSHAKMQHRSTVHINSVNLGDR